MASPWVTFGSWRCGDRPSGKAALCVCGPAARFTVLTPRRFRKKTAWVMRKSSPRSSALERAGGLSEAISGGPLQPGEPEFLEASRYPREPARRFDQPATTVRTVPPRRHHPDPGRPASGHRALHRTHPHPTATCARLSRGCGRARWLRRPCRPRSGKVLHPPGSARRRRIPLPVEPRVMATGMLALNSAICGGHKRYRTAFCDGTMATACLHRVRRNGQVALTAVPLMLAALPNCNLGRRPGAQGGRATHLFGPINTR